MAAGDGRKGGKNGTQKKTPAALGTTPKSSKEKKKNQKDLRSRSAMTSVPAERAPLVMLGCWTALFVRSNGITRALTSRVFPRTLLPTLRHGNARSAL